MIKLPFLKKSSKKLAKFLAIDVSANCIKCLAFYKEDGKIKIIGNAKENIEQGVVRNGFITDPDAVLQYTKEAIFKVTKNLEDKIDHVIFGLSSDACIENVTTAKITRANLEPIAAKEANEYRQKIIDSSYIQVQSNYAETTGNSDVDFELITSSTVYTKIDNHKVSELEKQAGKVVELAVYTCFCPDHLVKAFQALAKNLKLKILALSSETFALLKALSASDLESNDLVAIHVGADFTNVSVVFGGAIVSNKSLHIGKKQFIDEISRIMGLAPHESEKVIETYIQGNLSQSEGVVVQNCLSDVTEIWLSGIQLLFSEFSGVKTFAPHVYLYGEGAMLPEIEEMLIKEPWTKGIPFKSPPQIQSLQMNLLKKVTDATGFVNSGDWLTVSGLSYIFEEII